MVRELVLPTSETMPKMMMKILTLRFHFFHQLEHRHLSPEEIILIDEGSFWGVTERQAFQEEGDFNQNISQFNGKGQSEVVSEETGQARCGWRQLLSHQLPARRLSDAFLHDEGDLAISQNVLYRALLLNFANHVACSKCGTDGEATASVASADCV